jgi:gliding motility-associated-like protein
MVVTKFDNLLSSIAWSTLFGNGLGKPNLSPTAFLVDVCGKIYLSGWGGNVNQYSTTEAGFTNGLLVTPGAYQTTTDGSDFYLLVLEADASAVTYASFFGGNISSEHVDGGTSRFDRKGIIYQSVCAGCGGNSDFPIYPPNAVSAINNNSCNNGVFKYDFQLPLTVADFQLPNQLCTGTSEVLLSTSSLATSLEWFVDGVSIGMGNPLNYTFSTGGIHEVTLVASNPNTCNFVDSISRVIDIIDPLVQDLTDVTSCAGVPVQLGDGIIFDPNASYTWLPNDGSIQNTNSPFPLFVGNTSNTYTVLVNHGLCTDTLTQSVMVPQLDLSISNDTTLCVPDVVDLIASASPQNGNLIWSTSFNFMNPINVGGESGITVMVNGSQTYYVQYTLQGCSVSDSVQVNLVENQTEIVGDFTACVGDTISLFVLNPNPQFTYEWNTNADILNGQGTSEIEIVLNSSVAVGITAQTPFGCSASDQVNVTVSSLTPQSIQASASDYLVLSGTQVQLNANPTGLNYQWTPIGGLSNSTIENPIATLDSTTTFWVTITDGECILSDSVVIRVTDFICGNPTVFVPNAFTPNADNKNEWLYVRGNFITEMDFFVFDRWGEKVFESHELSNGWNGFFEGKRVDPAVFAYYLRVVCDGGEVYFEEGNITVLE